MQELEWRIVRKYYSMAQQKAYRNCGRHFVALAGAHYASAQAQSSSMVNEGMTTAPSLRVTRLITLLSFEALT